LTCANKLIGAVACIVLCASALFAATPTFTATREITSNNAYSLAGYGDTVWVVTDVGINCAVVSADTLSWSGYKSKDFNGTLAYGAGHVLAGLWPTSTTKNSFQVDTGDVWLYARATNNFMLISPAFTVAASLDTLRRAADFSVHDIAWSSGFFWAAAGDGQLMRVSIADTSCTAYMPGTKIVARSSTFVDSIVTTYGGLPDSMRCAVAVEVQDTSAAHPVVWLATPVRIWKFTPANTAWDSLPSAFTDTRLSLKYFVNVFVAQKPDSGHIYASIATALSSSTKPDTGLFRYSPLRKAWVQCSDNAPSSVTFGDSGTVYVAAANQVQQYLESSDSLVLAIGSPAFRTRITKASGGNFPDYIHDVLYLPQSSDSAHFWIASSTAASPTNNGLFISLNERSDENDTAAFTYIHRDAKLSSGLSQCYAYPSIITDKTPIAVFAYNLSKASNVTIRVYDWNMDLVRTIINNAPRKAGTDQTSGRSTQSEDKWDGTNASGRHVAVGVYYYKITAQSGEHAFGKIIVAKSH
jgi:hypothetical protein